MLLWEGEKANVSFAHFPRIKRFGLWDKLEEPKQKRYILQIEANFFFGISPRSSLSIYLSYQKSNENERNNMGGGCVPWGKRKNDDEKKAKVIIFVSVDRDTATNVR